jgi:hypothetical protein
MATIGAAVGIRYGVTMMPNLKKDLDTITELFDRIPVARGGSMELGGVWATERDALIAEVTAQIVAFQTANARPVIDGVVDPNGGSLRLMNQLAVGPSPVPPNVGINAQVVDPPNGLPEAMGPFGIYVTDINRMQGTGPITPAVVTAEYTRKLVRVDGSSIIWFGVVLPTFGGAFLGGIPHINFTPTPIQGGYSDSTYDSFAGWGKLWDDYTSIIGGQVAASFAEQIVVFPFYKTSQQRALGSFLSDWKECVGAAVTAAINAFDPLFLRDTYTFDRIVSSSFSNGWVAHQQFNLNASGAASATDRIFDLDGIAGGSHWVPSNGIIYRNRTSPINANPVGNVWYVGGRWSKEFAALYGGNLNTHAACRNHLLYHGMMLS